MKSLRVFADLGEVRGGVVGWRGEVDGRKGGEGYR